MTPALCHFPVAVQMPRQTFKSKASSSNLFFSRHVYCFVKSYFISVYYVTVISSGNLIGDQDRPENSRRSRYAEKTLNEHTHKHIQETIRHLYNKSTINSLNSAKGMRHIGLFVVPQAVHAYSPYPHFSLPLLCAGQSFGSGSSASPRLCSLLNEWCV